MKTNNNIPKIPHALFKWYCQRERYEELHGDLEEFYYERVDEYGVTKARLYYLLDVIRCCQPYAWRKPKGQTNSTIIMFRNYSKTSLRRLMKNPMSSFINVFGLSVAIGICMLVYAFNGWVSGVDQFHINKEKVYLVTIFVDRDGTLQQNGQTPRPLAEMLKGDFGQIQKTCRVKDGNVVVKYEDNVFHERVRYVDPEFLEMLTFPLKWGSIRSLQDPNSIILNEEMSVKYFGAENPVGSDILMIFDENNSKAFKVGGVAKAFPDSHAIHFDFLVNFENIKAADPAYDTHDWSAFIDATLIQVDDPCHIPAIDKRMVRYKKMQNEAQEDWAISSFAFEPLATLYENSVNIKNSISSPYYYSNHQARIILSILALFMLALACFNYINIAIVSAAKRLKEIGLRKVIGANRRMVIIQFLAENMFVTFFALIIGIVLGVTVIIPWFEELNNFSTDFELLDGKLWIFLTLVLFITGFLSGIYPAFYISKFQVATIFKGSAQFGRKNRMTEVFLGFQLILSCILIVCAVVFTQNNDYMANRSWGYDPGHALYVNVHDYAAFEQLKTAIIPDPNIVSVSGSENHLGRSHVTTVLHFPDRYYEVDQLAVDAHYFETMELERVAGRLFYEDAENDKRTVVVNELLVKNLELNNALGTQFEIDSIQHEIIGVVKDFHSYSFAEAVQPTIFRVADEKEFQYLSMRVTPGTEMETYKTLQSQWATLFPEIPFQGGYQEDVWGNYFEEVASHGQFWRIVAFIAILLAGLGLFGLVSLNVAGREREFSIRKVLGARLINIAVNMIRQYIGLFALALLIGAPLSYYLITMFFDLVYEYHIPINYTGVVISVLMLTGVLLIVISSQLGQISRSNPVDGLKAE
ncbi:FtsX-like permease family protein [Fulvivirga sp. M361]|uniref:FtsX-like permease family protein n=1 Tax=Fulvivirga sp. M361 TaxID=2594266 RepID=UPI00117BD176|nr:FtsX-like permease family protein [Fulvivirga sp. M361]TRX60087.1 FtsX-like permease family protein [Fulvivirga sp. M361]